MPLQPVIFVAAALLLAGCFSSNSEVSDRHIPPDATLQGLVPDPIPASNLQFSESKHYALHDSALAADLTAVPAVRLEPAATLKNEPGNPTWSFGLGREELAAKLGSAAMIQAEQNLAAYYAGLFGHSDTDSALREAVQRFPHWAGVDTDSAQDLGQLRIESVALVSGAATDDNQDGEFETPQTLVTVIMSLPAITITPSDPLPGCAPLLADTAAIIQYAEDFGLSFIAPGAAQWQYQLKLAAHFYLADRAEEHAGLIDPAKGYLTTDQVLAAARNLGFFSHLLTNIQTLDIPSSDLMVSFSAAPALRQQTIGIIAGMARNENDVECLLAVDAWDAEPAIIHPGLSSAQLQGAEPPAFLLHTYNPAFDAAVGIAGETGISCLHDAAGNIVQVADNLACAASSGPVTFEAAGPAIALFLGSAQGYQAVTPYQRIQRRIAAETMGFDGVLQPMHVHVGNFTWTCTNSHAVCSGRFGRGNRVCLSEWVIHNQVGDYWNIHWYQSAGKAATQTAIKAGAYVVRAVVSYYVGGRAWSGPLLEMLTYAGDVIDHALNTKIAGHSIGGAKVVGAVVYEGVTKLKTIGPDLKAAGIMFAFDKVVDMAAQIGEVQAVGWQDYSHGSHCACGFQFRHPNYCS
ncbi:hypothetical protein ACHHRT_11805 [Desulfurivibrio sp. D14AmB]|uniref:hypothetical protein n=1 Tax=Desulfurivibrio sp. D14AmB TaxID=3374370 RepID=UPI00376F2017